MSKEEGKMVQSRTRKGSGAARPESGPTARPGRTLWRGGSGGARDGNGTWCCGANRWRRCRGEVGVEIYRLEAWRERAVAGLEVGLKEHPGEPLAAGRSTRRSDTLGSCRWRTSCCASGRGPRSDAALWRCGGRGDERHDLRGHGAPLRAPARVSGVGTLALGPLRPADTRADADGGRGASPGRGPTPQVSDETLLAAIQADRDRSPFQADRDRSPFQGEGHRKVHARLRLLDGIRVARTRVLRVMRAHGLLSPHRGRQRAAARARRDDRHAGAEPDVGDRWRAGVHGG